MSSLLEMKEISAERTCAAGIRALPGRDVGVKSRTLFEKVLIFPFAVEVCGLGVGFRIFGEFVAETLYEHVIHLVGPQG